MIITDLAPEPAHLVRRNNVYVLSGGHIEDFNHAQDVEFRTLVAAASEQVTHQPVAVTR